MTFYLAGTAVLTLNTRRWAYFGKVEQNLFFRAALSASTPTLSGWSLRFPSRAAHKKRCGVLRLEANLFVNLNRSPPVSVRTKDRC